MPVAHCLQTQVRNTRVLDQLICERFRISIVAACWLIGVAALICAPAAAQTLTAGIAANPTSIASGGSSTLTWTSTNAVSGNLNGTPVPVNGSQVVSPTATTTYRFTATSASGATDWGQVTVTVSGSGGAPTAGITANPTSTPSRGRPPLTRPSTNATSANLTRTPVPVKRAQGVSPTSNTPYTFTATSASGATD